MNEPGPLLATGRDSSIFEYGPGLVLRRSRHGRSMVTEAKTMEYARSHGYPVPAVEELSADGTDLVMERIDGPSMMTVLSRRPWTVRQQGTVLADLHRRLHEIPAPGWVAAFGDGDRLLHSDLHPLNVIMSPKGPVVIDWPNAVRGGGASDVALTWVLMAAGGIPAGRVKAALLGHGRALFINSFLRGFDLAVVRARLAEVVDWKLNDANMTPAERQAMTNLVHANEPHRRD